MTSFEICTRKLHKTKIGCQLEMHMKYIFIDYIIYYYTV